MKKVGIIKLAVALLAVLAMNGTGWAAKGGGGPGVSGALNSTRSSAVVSVSVPAYAQCDALNLTQTYAVKAYIFQPSGRIFAIGITEPPTSFTCNPAGTTVDVTVNAFSGLTFKPGPATLLFQVILTENDGVNPAVDSVIYENGSRVDLH